MKAGKAVAELTREGLSTRQIGDVLGVDNATVHRDRVADATPEPPANAEMVEPTVADATPPDLEAEAGR